MGKAPCCDKANVKKGPWSPEEDKKLKAFIEKNGTGGNWIALPQKAGLKRCGKSCRLRWLNYLRPNIKHGEFSPEEDRIICNLHANIGSRWSIIAAQLPGRTDNDIKNYWNTKLKKKLLGIYQTLKKPNQAQQQPHLPSSLETQPSSLSNFHFHPFQVPQNNPCSTLLQPLLHHNLYNKDCGGNVLMFAGEHPSCSSSDGSSNQLSNGKEAEFELGFESFCYGGLDEYHKLLMNQSNGENGVGLFVSGYGVKEELMRYNNGGVFFDVDASIGSRGNGTRSQERGLYYY